MTECLFCLEEYDMETHDTCPSCAVNTDTKGITIITLENKEQH